MALDSPQNNSQEQPPLTYRDDWTMVVDLGTVSNLKGPDGRMGGEQTVHDLEAQLSKLPPPPKGFKGDAVRLIVGALTSHEGKDNNGLDFNVYNLENGHLKLLSSTPTAGLESDLRKLTGYASPRFRDEKMALYLNAHGTSSPGYFVGGDEQQQNGSIGAEAFRDIVNTWLNTDPLGLDRSMSGGRRLEFLNQSSCLGAKLGSLNLDAKLAKNVVTSELIVHSGVFSPGASSPDQVLDGQNVAKIYEELIKNPRVSGAQLADLVITDANAGANDLTVADTTLSATPTLGNYDMGAARDALNKSLDGLGTVLTAGLASPQFRQQVGAVIDSMPDLWLDDDLSKPVDAKFSERDLKTFLDQIKAAVDSKKLLDPDGSLARAIDTASSAESNFVKGLHASAKADQWPHTQFIDPEKLGGVSVSLPVKNVRLDRALSDDDYSGSICSDVSDQEAPNWNKFLTALREVPPRIPLTYTKSK